MGHAANPTTDPLSQSVDVSLTLPSEHLPSTRRWCKSLHSGFLALGLTLTAAFSLSIAILAYYGQLQVQSLCRSHSFNLTFQPEM
jgi:hypothetical protein